MLLFTRRYPARCFGMNMPKSRDIQREFLRFAYILCIAKRVTEHGVNSNSVIVDILTESAE